MRKYIILSPFALILFCCAPAAKALYGIKRPQLESKSSIQRFVHEHSVDTSKIVYFKDFDAFLKASQMKMLRFPDAIFYNSAGKQVPYLKSSTDCNASVDGFISDLRGFNSIPPGNGDISALSKLVDAYKVTNANDSITVFITFAKYTGKLNRTKAFNWVKLLDKAKSDGINVNYYLLSCDYQKSWNIPPVLYDRLNIKD